jgi:hypothetical protein
MALFNHLATLTRRHILQHNPTSQPTSRHPSPDLELALADTDVASLSQKYRQIRNQVTMARAFVPSTYGGIGEFEVYITP